jgi:cytochrome P450
MEEAKRIDSHFRSCTMVLMSEAPVSDDARYRKLFDLAREAREHGDNINYDINCDLKRLREQAPVHRGTLRTLLKVGGRASFESDLPAYTFFSYRSCERAFLDGTVFQSESYLASPAIRSLGPNILAMSGDTHRRYRSTSQAMFLKPRVTSWWKPKWIDDPVENLLDRIQGMDKADLNVDLFARLPVHVITTAIGLRDDLTLTFREHLLKAANLFPATLEEQRYSYGRVEGMLRDLLSERRSNPSDDIISGLTQADFKTPEGGTRKLTDEEVLSYCRLVLLAGGGTTWRQLGITVYALLSHYMCWVACRDDRTLIGDTVEEALRWNGTNPVFPRITHQDVEVEGVHIPANTWVDICLGAANRDPARWDNPDAFDIFRERKQHLSFGTGAHHCLGQYVARQEIVGVLNGLTERFPDMHLDPDAPPVFFTGSLENRGVSALPVVLR